MYKVHLYRGIYTLYYYRVWSRRRPCTYSQQHEGPAVSIMHVLVFFLIACHTQYDTLSVISACVRTTVAIKSLFYDPPSPHGGKAT